MFRVFNQLKSIINKDSMLSILL